MNLGIVLHCGLPLGTPKRRLDAVADGPLASLFDGLQQQPTMAIALHLGGHILDHLLRERRERMVQLIGLVQDGAIELLGGGYYDPVLSVLPAADRHKQLARTGTLFEEQVRLSPMGAWLPEQVFEPCLIPPLAEAGYRYIFLPGDAVSAAGWEDDGSGRPLRLEQGGMRLLGLVVPSSQTTDIFADYESHAGRDALLWSGDLLALGPDQQLDATGADVRRWLHRVAELPGVELKTPSAFAALPPGPLVYPGAGCQRDMATWSLPVEAGGRRRRILDSAAQRGGREALALLAGGRWSAFLERYPEAGAMYTRSIEVSRRIMDSELTGYWRDRMWASVLQTQGHEALQHGLSSGIYSPLLRQAVHARLGDVEDYLDHLEAAAAAEPKRLNSLRAQRRTLLPDGTQAVVLSGTRGRWTVVPSRGGALAGMQVPGGSWDVLHVMGAYRELGGPEVEVGQPCWSLGDRIDIDGTVHCLGDQVYRSTLVSEGLRLDLQPEEGPLAGLAITRRMLVGRFGSELRSTLTLRSKNGQPSRGLYRPRLYLSLPPSERNQMRLGERSVPLSESAEERLDRLQFAAPSARLAVTLQWAEPTTTRCEPVLTTQRDRGVIRSVHQGQRVELAIPFALLPDQPWSVTIVLRVVRHG